MGNTVTETASNEGMSANQKLFLSYFTAILIDLVVLNLFAEFWHRVTVESFLVSLFAAVILQVLLKITLAIEHHTAKYFNAKSGAWARVMRYVGAWAILLISKFIILWVIDLMFGDKITFGGPLHGAGTLIIVLLVMVLIERSILRFYQWLA